MTEGGLTRRTGDRECRRPRRRRQNGGSEPGRNPVCPRAGLQIGLPRSGRESFCETV